MTLESTKETRKELGRQRGARENHYLSVKQKSPDKDGLSG